MFNSHQLRWCSHLSPVASFTKDNYNYGRLSPWIEEASIGSFAGKLRLRKTIVSSVVLAKVEEPGKGWPSSDASDLYPSFRISDGQHSIMAYKVGNVSLEAANYELAKALKNRKISSPKN